MTFKDFYQYAVIINEVYDTKIPVNNWKTVDGILKGSVNINNEDYVIILEPRDYVYDNKSHPFINAAFAKMIDGVESQQLTLDNKSASKVIGALMNGIFEKVVEFDFDALVFTARDNVEQRMRIYNFIARNLGKKFLRQKENVPLPNGGKMTIMFSNEMTNEIITSFIEYVKELKK